MIFGVEEDEIESIEIRAMNPKCSIDFQSLESRITRETRLENLGYVRRSTTAPDQHTNFAFLKEVPCRKLSEIGDEVRALIPNVVTKKCVRSLQRKITGKDLKTRRCQAGLEVRGNDAVFFLVVMEMDEVPYD